jgi:hypothetical protein
VAKFCFVVFVVVAFLTFLVWQRRRLLNRPDDRDRKDS